MEEFENALKEREIAIQKRFAEMNNILVETQKRNWMLTNEFDAMKDRIRKALDELRNQGGQLGFDTSCIERQMNEMVEILSNDVRNYKRYYEKFDKLFENDDFTLEQKDGILSLDLKNFQMNLSKMKISSFDDKKLDLQQFVDDSSQFISNVVKQLDSIKSDTMHNTALSNKAKDLSKSLSQFEEKYLSSKENDCVDASLVEIPNSNNTLLMKNDRILQKLNDSNLYPLDVKMSDTYYSMCDNDTNSNLMFPTRSEGANSELIAATEVLRSMSNLTLNYDNNSAKEVRKRHANLATKKK